MLVGDFRSTECSVSGQAADLRSVLSPTRFMSTEAVINDSTAPGPSSEIVDQVVAALWHNALEQNPMTGLAADKRPREECVECLPFLVSTQIQHGQDRHINVAYHPSGLGHAEAVVLFLPGVNGGVGPCRAPGEDLDASALYPSLAAKLGEALPIDCHMISWMARSPDMEESVYAACRVALYALTLAKGKSRSGRRRLILVGHSYGAAVAFRVALKLNTELLLKVPAEVAGIIALSPQCNGALEAASALEDVPKLVIHSIDDQAVDVFSALALHLAAREPKALKLLTSGGHNLLEHKGALLQRLFSWIVAASSCTP